MLIWTVFLANVQNSNFCHHVYTVLGLLNDVFFQADFLFSECSNPILILEAGNYPRQRNIFLCCYRLEVYPTIFVRHVGRCILHKMSWWNIALPHTTRYHSHSPPYQVTPQTIQPIRTQQEVTKMLQRMAQTQVVENLLPLTRLCQAGMAVSQWMES